MRKYLLILSVFLFVLCLAFACSSSDDDSGDSATQQEDVEYLVAGIFDLIGSVFENEELPTGVTSEVDKDNLTLSLTLDSVSGGDRGYTASGTLTGAGTLSADKTTITIVFTGTITLTGGQISSLVWDVTVVVPWDEADNDFDGEPTSITGTVTADGTVYNIEDLDLSGDDSGDGSSVNPQFVVAGMKTDEGQSLIVYSADGSAWGYPNISQMASPAEDLKGIGCDPSGDCVAVGNNGAVFYSTNGTSWTAGDTGITYSLTGVAFGENRWVTVGAGLSNLGTVLYSDDKGKTWSAGSSSSTMYQFIDIAYGNGQWVAISPGNQQFYSLDGISWIEFDIGGVTSFSMRDVSFGDSTWVAVGDNGAIIYAADPSGTWSLSSFSGTQSFSGVNYGNSRFIAVGSGGGSAVLIVSTDNGQTWTEKTLPTEFTSTGNPLKDLAYGNGIWSVLGNYGDHLRSVNDGDTWTVAALDKYGAFAISYRAR
ncbi:hypothetical protein KJ966_26870 [bacterium]|nr:hypothetical protein [bacterium]